MDVKGMREILFRGKRIDNAEWVEGHYHFANWYLPPSMEIVDRTYYILQIGCGDADKVDPETVGQYTGLTDKKGKKIFEGDIVRHYNHSVDTEKYEAGKVFFDSHSACFKRTSNPGAVYLGRRCTYEVIGNIYDNPELLESFNGGV